MTQLKMQVSNQILKKSLAFLDRSNLPWRAVQNAWRAGAKTVTVPMMRRAHADLFSDGTGCHQKKLLTAGEPAWGQPEIIDPAGIGVQPAGDPIYPKRNLSFCFLEMILDTRHLTGLPGRSFG